MTPIIALIVILAVLTDPASAARQRDGLPGPNRTGRTNGPPPMRSTP
jgi:hypothetical protein